MKEIGAEDVADFVKNGDRVAFGGFTPAGSPKVSGIAIAGKAEAEHAEGKPFKIHVLSGASTGDAIDGALAKAKAVASRTPYQTNGAMRDAINAGEISYWDMHISHFAQQAREKIFGEIDLAIIEAVDISESGEILLSTAVGMAPTFCKYAKKIAIELNEYHPKKIRGLHDIYELSSAPNTNPIPLLAASDRIGSETLTVDPKKIVGVIRTNLPDQARPMADPDADTDRIGENVARFLVDEMRSGRISKQFLPIQSGVGNIANAVLGAMSIDPAIPTYAMYSEVLQDSVIAAIRAGDISFASATALAVSEDCLAEIYGDYDFFKSRLILRPEEISNHPEIALRLGLIAINTALEADICGNVNSTHVLGNKIMNGIGGSADFARNSHISIFACKSTAKDGKISAIVPLCSHIDHSEHSVKVLVTEQGVADLRGKDPRQRARAIIDNCAHPNYRDLLNQYLALASGGHEPFSLTNAFRMHETFASEGDMRRTSWTSRR
ncbi:MAG: succinate CoA transferase [Puniceicoccales bacterium]|jgi:succinate CoA transferase|nr:succinate CoA transferase [Puniceicoccales bacterium]